MHRFDLERDPEIITLPITAYNETCGIVTNVWNELHILSILYNNFFMVYIVHRAKPTLVSNKNGSLSTDLSLSSVWIFAIIVFTIITTQCQPTFTVSTEQCHPCVQWTPLSTNVTMSIDDYSEYCVSTANIYTVSAPSIIVYNEYFIYNDHRALLVGNYSDYRATSTIVCNGHLVCSH